MLPRFLFRSIFFSFLKRIPHSYSAFRTRRAPPPAKAAARVRRARGHPPPGAGSRLCGAPGDCGPNGVASGPTALRLTRAAGKRLAVFTGRIPPPGPTPDSPTAKRDPREGARLRRLKKQDGKPKAAPEETARRGPRRVRRAVVADAAGVPGGAGSGLSALGPSTRIRHRPRLPVPCQLRSECSCHRADSPKPPNSGRGDRVRPQLPRPRRGPPFPEEGTEHTDISTDSRRRHPSPAPCAPNGTPGSSGSATHAPCCSPQRAEGQAHMSE